MTPPRSAPSSPRSRRRGRCSKRLSATPPARLSLTRSRQSRGCTATRIPTLRLRRLRRRGSASRRSSAAPRSRSSSDTKFSTCARGGSTRARRSARLCGGCVTWMAASAGQTCSLRLATIRATSRCLRRWRASARRLPRSATPRRGRSTKRRTTRIGGASGRRSSTRRERARRRPWRRRQRRWRRWRRRPPQGRYRRCQQRRRRRRRRGRGHQ
ncbi:hypothetical protein BU14_0483s0011 [Porphyra umbilicalis]|uniref:Uncharacterized protein n=1 Tax=Porphyra umbilicalis TaxID=2786 RepID=A0A1X6NTR5_PORUM|nr:hypothetical protein BU14_0483s0011 [Porphyra umbilicalis]|eukprot:OSX71998.1 hypothetical protein BU14_0483s0011 [Porphyra umbilicalis]